VIWKTFFSVLGLVSLYSILHKYGFDRIGNDLGNLGWWFIPLALSFVPVAFCYSLAWKLTVPELPISKAGMFFRFTLVSVAWNNLSPFVKVLGEPMRVSLLEKSVPRKIAIRSVVLYNLVHLLGTIIAFVFGAFIILFYFPVSSSIRLGFIGLIVFFSLLFVITYFLPKFRLRAKRTPGKKGFFLKMGFWIRWAFSRVRMFSKAHPGKFWAGVFLETLARFVEGLTFYVAFHALNDPVPALYCALLDVGRALMDNIFFFIPYQVGSREAGLLLLSDHVIHMGAATAVSAAVFYRLVEILWMGIGYGLWMYEARSARSST
jgi:uncharacterized protein (TIRG00374 family)